MTSDTSAEVASTVLRWNAGDIEIFGDYLAREDAPLVIFSHGGGQTRYSWRGAAERAAQLGFETLSVDLRGHGDSGWAQPQKYQLSDFVQDLRGLARGLGRGRAVALVGASLGGMISLIAATDPTINVRAVTLVDVVPRVETAGATRIRAFMERHDTGFATLSEAADAIAEYRGKPPASDLSGLSKNLRLREDGRYYWHWDPTFLARMPEAGKRTAMLEEAARTYRGPLLLLHGLQSDIVGTAGVAALRALAPQLEYIDIPQASHMVVNDRNDAFNDAIQRFLSKHLGSRLPTTPAR